MGEDEENSPQEGGKWNLRSLGEGKKDPFRGRARKGKQFPSPGEGREGEKNPLSGKGRISLRRMEILYPPQGKGKRISPEGWKENPNLGKGRKLPMGKGRIISQGKRKENNPRGCKENEENLLGEGKLFP